MRDRSRKKRRAQAPTGSPTILIGSSALARVGDDIGVPGREEIVLTGEETVTANGRAVARVGGKTTLGRANQTIYNLLVGCR